jgi:hypothetical protein
MFPVTDQEFHIKFYIKRLGASLKKPKKYTNIPNPLKILLGIHMQAHSEIIILHNTFILKYNVETAH